MSLLPQRSGTQKARQSIASTARQPSGPHDSFLSSDQNGSSGILFDVATEKESLQSSPAIEKTSAVIKGKSGASEESKVGSNAQPREEACPQERTRALATSKAAEKLPMAPPSTTTRSRILRKPATFADTSATTTQTRMRRGTDFTNQVGTEKVVTQLDSSKLRARVDFRSRRNSSASNGSAETNYPKDRHGHNPLYDSRNVRDSSRTISAKVAGLRVASHNVEPQLDHADGVQSDIPSVRRDVPSRPVFSTLQQHYSPRKTAKTSASSLIPPSATKQSSDKAVAAPILRLQTELLQLHLMHGPSATVQRQWEASAELNLKQHFEDVRATHWRSHIAKQKAQERINIKALKEWIEHDSGFDSPERIQTLSSSVQDIYRTIDIDGRFTQLVKTFTQWTDTVQIIWQARREQRVGSRFDFEILEGLGDDWKAESAAISRKITTCVKNLERLPMSVDGSSLGTMMKVSQSLGACVIEELGIMQTTERQIVKDETAWVEEGISFLATDKLRMQPHRKGIWQAS